MSARGRIAVLAGVIVIAVVLFIVLQPSDNNSDTKTQTQTSSTAGGAKDKPSPPPVANVRVKNGKPVGGIQDLTFNKGGTVQFAVTSDVSDEVHVHGYDLMKDVAPGHPVKFKFPAKIDGEFEVELENRGEQIAALKVNP